VPTCQLLLVRCQSALLLGAAALLVVPALAQSTSSTSTTPTSAPTHHVVHHATRAGTHPGAPKPMSCPPVEAAPILPAGVPPAAGPVQTAFALRYIDTQIGAGALIQPGDFLTVHYTGWLASDGTKFDSSLDRGQPIDFQQGAHRVIPGWDQGFAGMHVGGKRRLFIPYQLAYGESGRPPVIPAKSDLIFDIELVAASATPPGMTPPVPPAQPANTPQR
jgi:peptidylprolyl isomerase